MTLGYRRATLSENGALGPRGKILRGHEFHYATVESQGDDPPSRWRRRLWRRGRAPVGSRRGRVTGSFFHVIAAERA